MGRIRLLEVGDLHGRGLSNDRKVFHFRHEKCQQSVDRTFLQKFLLKIIGLGIFDRILSIFGDRDCMFARESLGWGERSEH